MLTQNAVETHSSPTTSRARNIGLWTVQVLLAALFIFAGGMKLVVPIESLAGPVAFPDWFLRFIGVAELLGGLGLILPGALRIRPALTSLAASGLVIIMIGAVVVSAIGGGAAATAIPLATLVFCAIVAYARRPRGVQSEKLSIGTRIQSALRLENA